MLEVSIYIVFILVLSGLIYVNIKITAAIGQDHDQANAAIASPIIGKHFPISFQAILRDSIKLLYQAFLPLNRHVDRRLQNKKTRHQFYLAQLGTKSTPTTLKSDLVIGFGIWSFITSAVILFFSVLIIGSDANTIKFSVIYGLLLSITGNLICSTSITLLGSSAAGVVIGTAFGVSYGFMMKAEGVETVIKGYQELNLDIIVLGGMPSLKFPPFFVIIVTSLAISVAAYLMAVNSKNAVNQQFPHKKVILGIISGFMTGGLIAVILCASYFAEKLFPDCRNSAFLLAFCFIGSTTFALAVKLRMGKKKLNPIWIPGVFTLHILGWLIVVCLFDLFRHSVTGLFFSGMAHAMFHGTFFAISYIIAERIGGRLAGGISSGLVGFLGYIGFLTVFHNI